MEHGKADLDHSGNEAAHALFNRVAQAGTKVSVRKLAHCHFHMRTNEYM